MPLWWRVESLQTEGSGKVLAKSVKCSAYRNVTFALSGKFSIAGIVRRFNIVYGGLSQLDGYRSLLDPLRIYGYLVSGDPRYVVGGLGFRSGEAALVSLDGKRLLLRGSGPRLWRVILRTGWRRTSIIMKNINSPDDYSRIDRVQLQHYPETAMAAYTDKGPRASNEDSYALVRIATCKEGVASRVEAIIIADGAGGLGHGGLASGLTVSALSSLLTTNLLESAKIDMAEALGKVNEIVAARADQIRANMASTVSIAARMGNTISYAGVGDSKILSITNNKVQQLGEIHRASVEGKQALTSYIGRAQGLSRMSSGVLELSDDTVIVAMSDGVHDLITDEEVMVMVSHSPGLTDATRMLVEEALKRGTRDNATAAILYAHRRGAPGN